MLQTITENGVSPGARHLFFVLKDFARGKNWPECWPGKWLLAEEIGRSHRTVERYLQELERVGAIEVIRVDGGRNRYRVLLGVKDKIRSLCTDAPTTPMSGVVVCSIIEEAEIQQAAQVTEATAAAAAEKTSEEEMKTSFENLFGALVEMGMPASSEMAEAVKEDLDLAAIAVRHCKNRFSSGKKQVFAPGGYIVSFLRHPSKFGLVRRDGRWQDPSKPSGMTADDVRMMEAKRKEANERDRAKRQADAEKAYSEMKLTWDNLPEKAKKEIEDFILKERPLFHDSGADMVEFELACINEAVSPGRTNWFRRHMGMPLVKSEWASKRG